MDLSYRVLPVAHLDRPDRSGLVSAGEVQPRNSASSSRKVFFVWAPVSVFTTSPAEYRMKEGIDTTSCLVTVSMLASASSLTKVILSPCSAASSSMIGSVRRHGAHQVAQMSTSTGLSECRTSVSNVASVTAGTLLILGS